MAYTWPIAGAKPGSNVTNPYGAKQARSAGFTGLLPSSNVGLDIGAAQGTPIVSPAGATVVSVGTGMNAGWGNSVLLRDAQGNQWRLSHMRDVPLVTAGQQVAAGQQLGVVGMTGNATGPHLDLEYKPKDGGFANPMSLNYDVSGPGMGVSSGLPGGPSAPPPPASGGPPGPGDDKNKSALDRLRQQAAQLDATIAATEQTARSGGEFAQGEATKALPELYKQRDALQKQITDAEKAAGAAPEVRNFGSTAAPDWRQYDSQTGQWTPVPGVPAGASQQAAGKTVYNVGNGRLVAVDAQGNAQEIYAGTTAPAEPKARPTQVVGNRVYYTDTWEQVRELPEAPGAAESREVTLATAQATLDKALLELENARDPLVRQSKQLAYDTAKLAYDEAVRKSQQPTDVTTSRDQPFLVRRTPEGQTITEPNPNYQLPTLPAQSDPIAQWEQVRAEVQTEGTYERDRLLQLQREGKLPEGEAQLRWQGWLSRADARLAGAKTAAEEARRKQALEQEQAQLAETQRAEGINRERERLGVQAGQAAWQDIAKAAPGIRTPQFLQESAENRMRFQRGEPLQYSAAATDPAAYAARIPTREGVVSRAVAEVLQHISPAAAASIGRPFAPLGAAPDLNALWGQLGNIPMPGQPGYAGPGGAGGLPDLIESRQAGGPVQQGRPYLVGERGPELVTPAQPGSVLPAATTAQVLQLLAGLRMPLPGQPGQAGSGAGVYGAFPPPPPQSVTPTSPIPTSTTPSSWPGAAAARMNTLMRGRPGGQVGYGG